jgi:hypothetical protein
MPSFIEDNDIRAIVGTIILLLSLLCFFATCTWCIIKRDEKEKSKYFRSKNIINVHQCGVNNGKEHTEKAYSSLV